MTDTVRHAWTVLETIHAVVYFSPEVRSALAATGLRGFWMGYFASRSAAMGPVVPEVVAAGFYVFSPPMVARALPDAWRYATPAEVLAARLDGVREAGPRLLSETPVDAGIAAQARQVAEACVCHGRPLAAAHASLPWPDDPWLTLWQASTIIREHRGDGHVAALVHAGLDGCEALVFAAAAGVASREALQPNRGWSDDEWDAAASCLVARGLLDPGGALTAAGVDAHRHVEATTDELAAGPWNHIGPEATATLVGALEPLATSIAASGEIPYPNPIGLRRVGGGRA